MPRDRPPSIAELARIAGGSTAGDPSVRISGVTHDSRRVGPDDLFVAIPGAETDGHLFVEAAAAAGAVAALVERPVEIDLPTIVVGSTRRALGPVAHAIFGEPTRRIRVVGITGTNGKTTTAHMVAEILDRGAGPAASIGTLGVRVGSEKRKMGLTTPEASDLARELAQLASAGVSAVAMEVSSHAVALDRIGGIRFAAGLFTNLSPDHLDFHDTMERYGEAKIGFFRILRQQDGFAAVNAEDAWAERFATAGPDRTWRYSAKDDRAEIYARRIDLEPDGTELVVDTPSGVFETRLSMAGRFNAMNALGAAAIGVGLGVDLDTVAEALASVAYVPGRYEVYRGAGITTIVDYAHTPQAIERVLETVRDSADGRIFCVFGCGGERDRTKRPQMARVAGTLADVVFLTTDNPRRESLDQIANDAIPGFDGTGAIWRRIDDRAEAISAAVSQARAGDVVCVLGKGDEDAIVVGERRIPFVDRDVVRRALDAREARE